MKLEASWVAKVGVLIAELPSIQAILVASKQNLDAIIDHAIV